MVLKPVVHIDGRVYVLKFLHDSVGHWYLQATRKLISERFWWPRIQEYVNLYVRSCDASQNMKPIPKYVSILYRTLKNLFEVFSVDFSGPIPKSSRWNCFIIIGVENFTGWQISNETCNGSAETVIKFVEENLVHYFGPPRKLISDNAARFTSNSLIGFMQTNYVSCKNVLVYAPKSNGRSGRMVGTLMKIVGSLVAHEPL